MAYLRRLPLGLAQDKQGEEAANPVAAWQSGFC